MKKVVRNNDSYVAASYILAYSTRGKGKSFFSILRILKKARQDFERYTFPESTIKNEISKGEIVDLDI
jgi:hypothetical protein